LLEEVKQSDLALGHQLNVLQSKAPKRFASNNLIASPSPVSIAPGILTALVAIAKLETVIRWHRVGLRLFWRWKSRSAAGRRSSNKTLIRVRPGIGDEKIRPAWPNGGGNGLRLPCPI
jgi:hypothetical protein